MLTSRRALNLRESDMGDSLGRSARRSALTRLAVVVVLTSPLLLLLGLRATAQEDQAATKAGRRIDEDERPGTAGVGRGPQER